MQHKPIRPPAQLLPAAYAVSHLPVIWVSHMTCKVI